MNKRKISSFKIMIGILFLLFAIISFGIIKYSQSNKNSNNEDVDNSVPTISIKYNQINKEANKYSYEDDKYRSMFGIDVSEFQDDIDWKKVKDAGVEFVFIRIGRRGATTGYLYEDEHFEVNYKGAKENGLKVGVYFFSQAITNKEARDEADWVAYHLKGKTIDFPVAYDCEEVILQNEVSRMISMDKEKLTMHADTFCKRMARNGYESYIYTNQFWAESMYDMNELTKYPIWFAQYDVDEPTLEYPIEIWQYADDGEIGGIDVPVDLNIMFIKKDGNN